MSCVVVFFGYFALFISPDSSLSPPNQIMIKYWYRPLGIALPAIPAASLPNYNYYFMNKTVKQSYTFAILNLGIYGIV